MTAPSMRPITAADGPRRLWIKATRNWFVIGLHCATRGHQWRTYRMFNASVTTCAWCGKLRGMRDVEVIVAGPKQRVVRTVVVKRDQREPETSQPE